MVRWSTEVSFIRHDCLELGNSDELVSDTLLGLRNRLGSGHITSDSLLSDLTLVSREWERCCTGR